MFFTSQQHYNTRKNARIIPRRVSLDWLQVSTAREGVVQGLIPDGRNLTYISAVKTDRVVKVFS